MRQEKLEQIIEMIPVMKNMVNEDMAISVWDRSGVVLYFSAAQSFPLHFDIGYKLADKNDKLFKAMEVGKTMHNVVPKEVFGVHIEANLVPVHDDGKVVGCIACALSLEKMHELENKSNKLKNTLDESKDAINNILNAVIDTTNHLNEMNKYIDALEASVAGVYGVVESIKGNTSRTKMLALNASIEAARAGEAGKGFKIVASEMGALSQMSAESVSEINKTLNEMIKSIENVTKTIKEIDNVSFKNTEVVEKILVDLNETLD